MIYPDTFEKKVGFDGVRSEVMRLCLSDAARRVADMQLQFVNDPEMIRRRLTSVDEMAAILGGDTAFPLGASGDIEELLSRVRPIGTFLGAEELNLVNHSLRMAAAIADFFSSTARDGHAPYPVLAGIADGIERFDAVTATISRSIDRFGDVKDSASPELEQTRRQLQH
ncbi:MAG: endonuclease MutS2, partial [Muribaculaceae bacterium]|nr:endonuclease MutS2 [Muribaculaceae bacterium]